MVRVAFAATPICAIEFSPRVFAVAFRAYMVAEKKLWWAKTSLEFSRKARGYNMVSVGKVDDLEKDSFIPLANLTDSVYGLSV